MIRKLFAVAAALCMVLAATAQSVTGHWSGALNVNGMKLTLVLHLADGKCTLDSPDQNAKGIPAEVLHNEGDSLAVEVKMLGAKYCARLADGRLTGTFSQRGLSFPLELTEGEVVRHRPQTPQPPFPYRTQELTFKSEQDGAVLAGTLTLPADREDAPLVVMVSGSGQQDRDETLFDHKPFAVIADRLARHGIASFRYDDRGVGGSGGLRADLTTDDFRTDALSAVRMLRRQGVARRIGILGHSEGGLIAFMLAGAEPAEVDFIVSLAGTAVSGECIMRSQIKTAAERMGQHMTDEQVQANIVLASTQPWFRFFVGYDPAPAIGRITCPVFAANGAKDVQVLAGQNLPALRQALKLKPVDRIVEYEGLNHLFQHADTGMLDEYGEIEETVAEELLADLVAWLTALSE